MYATFQQNIFMYSKLKKKKGFEELPGGPVVRTQRFHCRGSGLIPGQGTKIPTSNVVQQKKKGGGGFGREKLAIWLQQIDKNRPQQ